MSSLISAAQVMCNYTLDAIQLAAIQEAMGDGGDARRATLLVALASSGHDVARRAGHMMEWFPPAASIDDEARLLVSFLESVRFERSSVATDSYAWILTSPEKIPHVSVISPLGACTNVCISSATTVGEIVEAAAGVCSICLEAKFQTVLRSTCGNELHDVHEACWHHIPINARTGRRHCPVCRATCSVPVTRSNAIIPRCVYRHRYVKKSSPTPVSPSKRMFGQVQPHMTEAELLSTLATTETRTSAMVTLPVLDLVIDTSSSTYTNTLEMNHYRYKAPQWHLPEISQVIHQVTSAFLKKPVMSGNMVPVSMTFFNDNADLAASHNLPMSLMTCPGEPDVKEDGTLYRVDASAGQSISVGHGVHVPVLGNVCILRDELSSSGRYVGNNTPFVEGSGDDRIEYEGIAHFYAVVDRTNQCKRGGTSMHSASQCVNKFVSRLGLLLPSYSSSTGAVEMTSILPSTVIITDGDLSSSSDREVAKHCSSAMGRQYIHSCHYMTEEGVNKTFVPYGQIVQVVSGANTCSQLKNVPALAEVILAVDTTNLERDITEAARNPSDEAICGMALRMLAPMKPPVSMIPADAVARIREMFQESPSKVLSVIVDMAVEHIAKAMQENHAMILSMDTIVSFTNYGHYPVCVTLRRGGLTKKLYVPGEGTEMVETMWWHESDGYTVDVYTEDVYAERLAAPSGGSSSGGSPDIMGRPYHGKRGVYRKRVGDRKSAFTKM